MTCRKMPPLQLVCLWDCHGAPACRERTVNINSSGVNTCGTGRGSTGNARGYDAVFIITLLWCDTDKYYISFPGQYRITSSQSNQLLYFTPLRPSLYSEGTICVVTILSGHMQNETDVLLYYLHNPSPFSRCSLLLGH
jgi:hypothetical protein